MRDTPVTGRPRRDKVVTFRINGRDLEAIDTLVEAGIRTSRSAATAWLIQAGIVAHREMFDRIGATVGGIRRLRRAARQAALGAANARDGG